MILVCYLLGQGGKEVINNRFSINGGLLLLDQDFSQASYKMMREQIEWEEWEAFLLLVLTFVFV